MLTEPLLSWTKSSARGRGHHGGEGASLGLEFQTVTQYTSLLTQTQKNRLIPKDIVGWGLWKGAAVLAQRLSSGEKGDEQGAGDGDPGSRPPTNAWSS